MPAARKRLALLLLGVLAASCGGAGAGEEAATFQVHGLAVVVETPAPFAHRDAFPARVEAVIDAALAYWGGGWDRLAGRRLTLSAGPYVACGGRPSATGCWDGDLRVATWDPGVGTVSCLEQTALVHEIGHAIVDDPMHRDRRWMEFDGLAAALAGDGPGWAPDGTEGPCTIAPSVWRHPLDAP